MEIRSKACMKTMEETNKIKRFESITKKFSWLRNTAKNILRKSPHVQFIEEKSNLTNIDACICLRNASVSFYMVFETLDESQTRGRKKIQAARQLQKLMVLLNRKANCEL